MLLHWVCYGDTDEKTGKTLAEKIAAAAIEEGDEVPEAIANVPELDVYQTQLYDAFIELNTCRFFSSGMEGPIPWTSIRSYAIAEGLGDPDDFDFFRLVIRGLDRAYLAMVRKKRADEKERDRASRAAPTAPRRRR